MTCNSNLTTVVPSRDCLLDGAIRLNVKGGPACITLELPLTLGPGIVCPHIFQHDASCKVYVTPSCGNRHARGGRVKTHVQQLIDRIVSPEAAPLLRLCHCIATSMALTGNGSSTWRRDLLPSTSGWGSDTPSVVFAGAGWASTTKGVAFWESGTTGTGRWAKRTAGPCSTAKSADRAVGKCTSSSTSWRALHTVALVHMPGHRGTLQGPLIWVRVRAPARMLVHYQRHFHCLLSIRLRKVSCKGGSRACLVDVAVSPCQEDWGRCQVPTAVPGHW